MIEVADAYRLLKLSVAPLPAVEMPLGSLLGRRLAHDVAATNDSPPFDKSVVDGYAISLADDSAELAVLEQVIAGGVPTQSLSHGGTIRVMTGAPIPGGADAVVKWEDCRELADDRVVNPRLAAKPGQCIMRRGAAFKAGDVLLRAGKSITPIDVGLLAELGIAVASASPQPRVAVLATGNELVGPGSPLGPGQIRNSNGPMLIAALAAAGYVATDLGVAKDEPGELRDKLSRGIDESDALLVSGGVSAGVMDLVPGIMSDLGVQEVFHKIRMKPGKPLWFGVRDDAGAGRRKYVFGLPGNPVSTLVAFRLFVTPLLATLQGAQFLPPATVACRLASTARHKGGRPTFHPCRVNAGDVLAAGVEIEPLPWQGSADLAALARAHGLVHLAAGDYELPPGATVEVTPL